ncbi:hypothetical protein N4807_10195 [Enterococcus faecalis]|uniref:hypothetical protein n=1 Tax=Enterococcus faecalis TaxID=1351 RepID=UPI0021DFF307|nr:hypothetical protein [Enterococcus faecalis]MCU9791875.1 hypothetical protein [Enterococcus faecalis]
MKSAHKTGFRNIISLVIVGIIYLQCVFFQQYLQRFIHVIDQEIAVGDLKSAQLSLDSNQFLTMQISMGRDIMSLLIITIGFYILFDFRNKFLLMKVLNKKDVETKIFLGVCPRYVVKELLLKNLFLYTEVFLLSYIVCVCIGIKLISLFNDMLPYDISSYDRNTIFLSMFIFMIAILFGLTIISLLVEITTMQKFKRTFSFY